MNFILFTFSVTLLAVSVSEEKENLIGMHFIVYYALTDIELWQILNSHLFRVFDSLNMYLFHVFFFLQ